ncbi:PREDICTED: serine/threonine-protein kinase PLK4-like [Priapulus caudatus]|uniref:Serine/threonine-protein kinase PLK4 n=1 Tax=Priapulus caudatus TaxID=37621 RepID=A0ABM1EQ37_PRICU|nr:PREDICTED: serine/threonine-protein kinase PLK4-like [Priapulus caudatus]
MAPGSAGFGDSIEHYQVLNLLGKGGFACVYKARCLNTGQLVAIKMIDKKLMQASGMVTRVRKEVEIHSRLKHPSILELFTYFEDNNYVYLVIEMCHNGELHRYLKSNCRVLSEDEARHCVRQVVQGMFYLHSHGIVHRDLTLANLLLTRDMNVKIADFGLATQLSVPDEKHFTMCGTPNYISPEIASRGAHGLEADVWSLGCMLYTMLVGKPPFDTDGVRTTLNRVVVGNYELPTSLSSQAKNLIQALLRKNPKERLKLTAIVDHPFMKMHGMEENSRGRRAVEHSIDSGQGTMSTTTTHTSSSRSRPLAVHPPSNLPTLTSYSDEPQSTHSHRSHDRWSSHERLRGHSEDKTCRQPLAQVNNRGSTSGSAYSRHPPSPPVRLKSSNKENRAPSSSEAFRSPLMSVEDILKKINTSLSSASLDNRSTHSKHRLVADDDKGGSIYRPRCNGDADPHRSRCAVDASSHSRHDDHMSEMKQAGDYSDGRQVHATTRQWETNSRDGRQATGNNTQRAPSSSDKHSAESGDPWTKNRETCAQEESRSRSLLRDTSNRDHASGGQLSRDVGGAAFGGRRREVSREGMLAVSTQDPLPSSCDAATDRILPPTRTGSPADVSARCAVRDEPPGGGGDVGLKGMTSPLNARRLRPTRQRTKNAMVGINAAADTIADTITHRMPNYWSRCDVATFIFVTLVEFLLLIPLFFPDHVDGCSGSSKFIGVMAADAIRLEYLSFTITINHPNKGKGVLLADKPPSPPPSSPTSKFQYASLPSKLWKKYIYAARFVKLVRAKTPKVTFYSSATKCMLMENSPDADFEACFYNGAKVTQTGTKTKIIEVDGQLVTVELDVHSLSSHTRGLYDHTVECRQHCMDVESALEHIQLRTGQDCFPVIVGRRPTPVHRGDDINARCGNNRTSLVDTRRSSRIQTSPSIALPTMRSFEGTILSTTTTQNNGTPSVPSHLADKRVLPPGDEKGRHQSQHSGSAQRRRSLSTSRVVRQVFVPDIGWASQTSSGEVKVLFNGGTQLSVEASSAMVTYTDSSAITTRYAQGDKLPEHVRVKLAQMPSVVDLLVNSPA